MCWRRIRPGPSRSGRGNRCRCRRRCRCRLKVCKCKQSKICPWLFYGSELMNVANEQLEQQSKRERKRRVGERESSELATTTMQAGRRANVCMRAKGRARGAQAGSIAPLGSAIILPVPVCCPGAALWSKVCEIPCKYELNNILGTKNAA